MSAPDCESARWRAWRSVDPPAMCDAGAWCVRASIESPDLPVTMSWMRCGRIDALFTARPFLARRIARTLSEEGFPVDRKRMRRLMRRMGIEALDRSRAPVIRAGAPIHPYLLPDLMIARRNQEILTSRCLLKFSKRSLRIEIYAASAI